MTYQSFSSVKANSCSVPFLRTSKSNRKISLQKKQLKPKMNRNRTSAQRPLICSNFEGHISKKSRNFRVQRKHFRPGFYGRPYSPKNTTQFLINKFEKTERNEVVPSNLPSDAFGSMAPLISSQEIEFCRC